MLADEDDPPAVPDLFNAALALARRPAWWWCSWCWPRGLGASSSED